MIPILRYLNDVSKMGNEANAYREMLCETSERINAVMLKESGISEKGDSIFVAPTLDLESISRKKRLFVLPMMLIKNWQTALWKKLKQVVIKKLA